MRNQNLLTLIKSTDGGVLGSNVRPGSLGFLHKVGYNHLIWGIESGVPVRYYPHPWLSVAKLLTEVSILWVCVAASVGVMEANVEEERPETWQVTCHTHHSTSYKVSIFMKHCHC